MNHRKCNEGLSLIPYTNRSYILGEIDDDVFDALNSGNHVSALNGYCLDALEYMPSGSMINCGSYAIPTRIDYTERELTLAERLAMIAEVDAILKEADES